MEFKVGDVVRDKRGTEYSLEDDLSCAMAANGNYQLVYRPSSREDVEVLREALRLYDALQPCDLVAAVRKVCNKPG